MNLKEAAKAQSLKATLVKVKLMHWYHDRDEAYIKTVKKDGSGYYHYNVGDKELLCKTNVWDFIEAKEGLRGTYYVWHFEDMARAIGLFPSDYEADYTMSAKTNPDNERWDFTLNCGEAFENPYGQTVVQYVGMMLWKNKRRSAV